MNDTESPLLRSLFDAAVELAPAEREAFLRSRTDDDALVRDVLALCATSDVTPTGAVYAARDAMLQSLAAPALAVGEQLGPWRIVGELGRGGMGLVYKVERSDGHYAQTAALKFIAGAPGREQLEHFGRERQTLAKLSHPHIARLLDGGASADGRPFLVMEYIDGMHIDRWCRERRLGSAQIVRLMLEACDAVAFAHRQLVIHCDIKPSNLLVDGDGRVVLLDFGVARLIGGIGEVADPGTEAPGFTPAYASPEQIAGSGVSTATDVYGLAAVFKVVIAHALDQPVARELAAIIEKAGAEQPQQRYGSADALAADLRRFLAREPVAAIGGGRWYRARCFLRRHAMPVALAAALVLSLGAGLAMTLIAFRDADRARLRAERTADFLGTILSAVDPNRARDLDRTLLREILDQAAEKANTELAGEPEVLAQVEDVIGETYSKLTEMEIGLTHMRRALELYPASALRERLLVRGKMANMLDALNRRSEALAEIEAVAQAFQASFPANDPDVLHARAILADQYARVGDWQRALPLARELQPLLERELGTGHRTTLSNLHGLGVALDASGDFPAAERTLLRLIDLRTANFGESHTHTISATSGLAVLYLQHGKFAQAEALLLSLHPRALKRLGDRNVQTINIASLLGSAMRLGGKLAESEQWYRFALDQSYALYGQGHVATLFYEQNFAHFEVAANRPADALQRLERIEPLLANSNGARSPVIADVNRARGRALTALGRYGEAKSALETALSIDRERYGSDDHPRMRENFDALAELEKTRTAAKP
jgi:tetratricopeptide (TPR) repeat protein/predicted Ser/Thr protein kinase